MGLSCPHTAVPLRIVQLLRVLADDVRFGQSDRLVGPMADNAHTAVVAREMTYRRAFAVSAEVHAVQWVKCDTAIPPTLPQCLCECITDVNKVLGPSNFPRQKMMPIDSVTCGASVHRCSDRDIRCCHWRPVFFFPIACQHRVQEVICE